MYGLSRHFPNQPFINRVGPLRHLHLPFYLVSSHSVSGQAVDETAMTLPNTVMEMVLAYHVLYWGKEYIDRRQQSSMRLQRQNYNAQVFPTATAILPLFQLNESFKPKDFFP